MYSDMWGRMPAQRYSDFAKRVQKCRSCQVSSRNDPTGVPNACKSLIYNGIRPTMNGSDHNLEGSMPASLKACKAESTSWSMTTEPDRLASTSCLSRQPARFFRKNICADVLGLSPVAPSNRAFVTASMPACFPAFKVRSNCSSSRLRLVTVEAEMPRLVAICSSESPIFARLYSFS